MTKTYYVGLDVHKETIAIAYATGETREDSVYHGPCGGSVLAAERALHKLTEKIKTDKRDASRARTDASDDLSRSLGEAGGNLKRS